MNFCNVAHNDYYFGEFDLKEENDYKLCYKCIVLLINMHH